jgi:glycosyltransferase involved in cell wall biosynthesis
VHRWYHRATVSSIRVFPVIRSAHLEEIDRFAPRRTLYFATNYDLDGREIPAHWQNVTALGALRIVLTAQADSLELFEPLWRTFLPIWFALALAQKCRRGSRPRVVGFFAIENSTLDALPAPTRVSRLATRVTAAALRVSIRHLVDRIVYGTQMSQDLYAAIIGPDGPESILSFDLLARRVSAAPSKTPLSAAFVGQLHERKGISALMRAWEQVEASITGAHLTVVGDGPCRRIVESWSAQQPNSRAFRGATRHADVLRMLASTSVLVAPSQRHGRWREQVGRPMQEALAVGTTVVTTTETGIATWLSAHGHRVIEAPVVEHCLVDAVIASLKDPVPPDQVLASLPAQDGRLVADAWLHRVPA